MLTLYLGNKNYSSWSLRPWLALRQLDIPFREARIPLYQPDSASRLLAVSPSGKVPALKDGELVVWDSLAIGEYLAERFPEHGLWPSNARLRAEARSVSAEMHAGFAALRSQMPMNLRASLPGCGHTPEVLADIARIQAIWQGLRQRHSQHGDFLFGPFSYADAMFAPVVCRLHTYGVALDGVAGRYADTLLALPALQAWYADACAESEVIAQAEPYRQG